MGLQYSNGISLKGSLKKTYSNCLSYNFPSQSQYVDSIEREALLNKESQRTQTAQIQLQNINVQSKKIVNSQFASCENSSIFPKSTSQSQLVNEKVKNTRSNEN